MHFKTFVLRTPSVPPQMMSQALCLGGREVVKWLVGIFFCLVLAPSCGVRAVLSGEQKRKGWGVSWDVGNYLLLNQRIM